ncbi:MAG: cation transporter [Bacilli bacterium]|nr:cation transporter [Bacilli bacterium]
MERLKKIVKISVDGIIVNILLVIFKLIIGFITNSIAITLDAINNLSDALSSIITILGAKFANKKPDKKHPYGYGRVEYFSSIIIALLILFAGITAFRESLLKIIHPEKAIYSIVSLIVIFVAVLVKYSFGNYVKRQGEKLNSKSLIASGADAISDSFLSFSTFIAAIISLLFNISLEGYLGIIISIFILKSSIDILIDTINDLIGTRADPELIKKLKKRILLYDEVQGVYDLTLHNYGPNKIIATAHIQVDDNMKAKEIHGLTRKITIDIYDKLGIILTIGIYASNDKGKYKEIKQYINSIIKKYKSIIQIHGFYVDEDENDITFDLIFNFEESNEEEIVEKIKKELKEKYSKYNFYIVIDTDFSD